MTKQRVINGHRMRRKGKLLHQVKPNRAADRDRLLTAQLADVCNALADALGMPDPLVDVDTWNKAVWFWCGRRIFRI